MPKTNLTLLVALFTASALAQSPPTGSAEEKAKKNPGATGGSEQEHKQGSAPPPAPGSSTSSSSSTSTTSDGQTGSLSVSADHQEQTAEGTFVFDGNVRILYRDLEMQADRVEVDKVRRSVTAEGNVLLVSGKLRLSGERAEIDLDSQTGTIYEGYALLDPSFIVRGDRIDKVADDRIVVYSGEITACDQAIPQWTVKSSKAKVKIGGYARLWNARINAKKVPFIYTPFLVWPVKSDRATGFLIPHVGSSFLRGTLISEAFYLVLGRSADATLYGDYYSKSGIAPGLQIRYQPAEGTVGDLSGFYLKDKRDGSKSYRYTINHQEKLGRYFRFVVNSSVVSDQSYFQSFERNLSNVGNRTSFGSAFLTGNFGNYSVNLQAQDNKNFYSFPSRNSTTGEVTTKDDTIETKQAPGLHVSRRDSKLIGPLHFLFDVDGANLGRKVASSSYDGSYSRVDAFPKLSLVTRGFPWLTITPTIGYRYSQWGKSTRLVPKDPNDPTQGSVLVLVDEPVKRTYGEADVQLLGPRFSKTWEKEALDEDTGKKKVKKRKHLIEPQISYRYVSSIDNSDRIPLFDTADVVRPLNLVKYGITNRFFVKRRLGERPDPLRPPTEYHYIYDATCNCYQKRSADSTSNPSGELSSFGEQVFEAPPDTDEEVFEILNFSFFESYSLDPNLATDYGIRYNYTGSQYIPNQAYQQSSPITFQLNYYPTLLSQVNVSADYNPNESRLIRASTTASLRDKKNRYLELTFTDNEDFLQRQLRFSFGYSILDERWRFELHQYYDLKNSTNTTGLKQQSYLVNFNAQCVGIIGEYSRQDFLGFKDNVFRIAITLPNVGTFLDLKRGGSGIFQGNRFGGSRGTPF